MQDLTFRVLEKTIFIFGRREGENKYTLSYMYRFLYGNVHGCVFAKNRPVSLNWSDYTFQRKNDKRMTKALNRLHKCAGWSMSVIRMKQNSGSLAVADPEGVRSNPLPVPCF